MMQQEELKPQSRYFTRKQRALAWLSLAIFFVAFVLFFVGYTGNSWYVSPVVGHYPPDSSVEPLNFGLFYLCFRGHCKFDLRQDYQIVNLLPPELEITWAYQQYRTACMIIVTIGAVGVLVALGSYFLFLSALVISMICGYVTAGLQILSAVIVLIGVSLFGIQFRGKIGTMPFGWSFALVIVGSVIFIVNGVLLIIHTIGIQNSASRQAAARRGKTGGILGCFQDCTKRH